MNPIEFKSQTGVLLGEGDVGSLPVYKDSKGSISCWQLTPEELEEVVKTGKIWLGVNTDYHPSVSLSVASPLESITELCGSLIYVEEDDYEEPVLCWRTAEHLVRLTTEDFAFSVCSYCLGDYQDSDIVLEVKELRASSQAASCDLDATPSF